jgi:hypothetical protein
MLSKSSSRISWWQVSHAGILHIRQYVAEPREDELQISVRCNGVELAHEQDVLGGLDVFVRQVSNLSPQQARC